MDGKLQNHDSVWAYWIIVMGLIADFRHHAIDLYVKK